MNRRSLLSAFGIGITTSIAGCIGDSDGLPEPTGNEEPVDYTEEEKEELREDTLEDVYDSRVENGQLVHSPNLNITSVENITDSSVTLETTFSINPVDDYTINLHYNPITTEENGEWVYENYVEPLYGSGQIEYDDSNHEWVNRDNHEYANYVQYDFGDATKGELLSSFTVPSEAFWDEDVDVGVNRGEREDVFNREDIYGYGWSYVNEFEFNKTPEMYETFVLSLTWEDENTVAPNSGEVVANSAPIMRVGENKYIYPLTHNGNSVINPTWDDKNVIGRDRNYERTDIYRNDISQDTNRNVNGNVVRVSNYGRFSPKMVNEFDTSSVSVTSEQGPKYVDADLQYPWSVSYEITRSMRNEASEIANSNRTGGSQVEAVSDFINSNEVMNHDLIQDVASQLGDICEIMDATHPSEQVRVVADFVQYFGHTFDGGVADFGQPGQMYTGTAHPVVTLYRGLGDCKDFTVLMNSIIRQEPFNMNPDAIVLPDIFEYTAEGRDDRNSIGHITTAIPVDEMKFDEVSPDTVPEPVNGDYETVMIDGVEHVYIETSGPFHIGYIHNQWTRRTDPVSMDEFANN